MAGERAWGGYDDGLWICSLMSYFFWGFLGARRGEVKTWMGNGVVV